MKNEGVQVWLQ